MGKHRLPTVKDNVAKISYIYFNMSQGMFMFIMFMFIITYYCLIGTPSSSKLNHGSYFCALETNGKP